MEGAKSTMYAQAGRNRGWSTVSPTNTEASVIERAAQISEPVPMSAPIPMPMYTMEQMRIPEPPVVELPDFMKPQDDCKSLAMAFVPMQKWQELYESEQGFHRGTIFTELDLPFAGEGACKDE